MSRLLSTRLFRKPRRSARISPRWFRPGLEWLEPRLAPATITVTTTADDQTVNRSVSLREAILSINQGSNFDADVVATGAPYGTNDTINFAIPGSGPFRIKVGTDPSAPNAALPPLFNPVVLDGTTQPGFAGKPTVILDGSGLSFFGTGLVLFTSNSTIRGLAIDNFSSGGIAITGPFATGNTIAGNYIGTDASGTAAQGNSSFGVEVSGGASNNIIGGTTADDRNIISGNQGPGVVLSGTGSNSLGLASSSDGGPIQLIGPATSGNVVEGNYIGLNADGSKALANKGDGVDIRDGASNNTIGGPTAASRNIISGNIGEGVLIYKTDGADTRDNTVENNYIGTDSTGSTDVGTDGLPLGNTNSGIFVPFSEGNQILNNVISGNRGFAGIALGGIQPGGGRFRLGSLFSTVGTGAGNVVQGNLIGTNAADTAALGNADFGISIDGGEGMTIGGPNDGQGNVIADNSGDGLFLFDRAQDMLILGNFIGTNPAGTPGLGNAGNGVLVEGGATGNDIGVTLSGVGNDLSHINDPIRLTGPGDLNGGLPSPGTVVGNVISGNAGNGIELTGTGTSGNVVEGNLIGTNAAGTAALPNAGDGVFIPTGATSNTIGGPTAGDRNIISGNTGSGIAIAGSSNTVQGNYVGTDRDGTAALPNGADGVELFGGASSNIIGAGNVIAFNGNTGVRVGGDAGDQAVNNAIRGNSIFGNAQLGIDLGSNGVTLNDSSGHSGPNHFQNFPVLTQVTASDNSRTVYGHLNSTLKTTFQIDFYANAAYDPSGYGQGQVYLGSVSVQTDVNGFAPITFKYPFDPDHPFLTATATDPSGNTSEFSGRDLRPENTVPGPQTTNENMPLAFSGARALSISDPDNNGTDPLQIALTVSHGTLTLASLAGLSGSGNGTASLTYTGTLADLDAALAGLVYTAAPSYVGPDTLTLTTSDLVAPDLGGPGTPPSSSVPITVMDVPLTNVTGVKVMATEGVSTGLVKVATFTDPGFSPAELDAQGNPRDYSATISWENNSGPDSSATVVANKDAQGRYDGTFSVFGSHTYAEEGTYTLTVTLKHGQLPPLPTPGQTVVVADQQLTTRTSATVEAELITNGGFETGDFTGWTVTDQPGGSGKWFPASGTTTPFSDHSTAGPASGKFYAVTDQSGPGSHALTQSFTVTPGSKVILSFDMFVNDYGGAVVLPGGANDLNFSGVSNEHGRVDILTGSASPFDTTTGVVENLYNGADPLESIPNHYTHYRFDITSAVGGGGTFQIRFAEADNQGFFNQGVDNVSIVASTVATGPARGNLPATGQEGVALGIITGIATFTDPAGVGVETTSDFTATINWGDGTTSPGTVVFVKSDAAGAHYRVDAPSHTYTEEGTYTVNVTLKHDQLATITTPDQSITISDQQLTGLASANLPATGQVGTALGIITGIATFTDPAGVGAETTNDFTAIINWGDGTTSPGTVVSLGGGNYRVDALSHIYLTAGTFTVNITLKHDQLPALTTPDQTIVVADQQLTTQASTNLPATGQEGGTGTVNVPLQQDALTTLTTPNQTITIAPPAVIQPNAPTPLVSILNNPIPAPTVAPPPIVAEATPAPVANTLLSTLTAVTALPQQTTTAIAQQTPQSGGSSEVAAPAAGKAALLEALETTARTGEFGSPFTYSGPGPVPPVTMSVVDAAQARTLTGAIRFSASSQESGGGSEEDQPTAKATQVASSVVAGDDSVAVVELLLQGKSAAAGSGSKAALEQRSRAVVSPEGDGNKAPGESSSPGEPSTPRNAPVAVIGPAPATWYWWVGGLGVVALGATAWLRWHFRPARQTGLPESVCRGDSSGEPGGSLS